MTKLVSRGQTVFSFVKKRSSHARLYYKNLYLNSVIGLKTRVLKRVLICNNISDDMVGIVIYLYVAAT